MNTLKLTLGFIIRVFVKLFIATLICVLSFVGAFLIRFEFNVNTPVFDAWFSAYTNNVMQITGLSIACFILIELLFKNRRISESGEFAKIFLATWLVEVSAWFYMLTTQQKLMRSVYIVSFLLMFFFLLGTRFLSKCASRKIRRILRKHYIGNKENEAKQSGNGENYLSQLDKIKFASINSKLEGRNVMITGAGGAYGSQLCKQLIKFKLRRLILVDIDEKGMESLLKELAKVDSSVKIEFYLADICNFVQMHKIFTRFRPHIIFHAAGYQLDDMALQNKGKVIYNNLFGTRKMLELAGKNLAEHFVLISYLQEGESQGFVERLKSKEEARAKLANEKYSTKFCTYRFGVTDIDSVGYEKLAGNTLGIFVEKGDKFAFNLSKVEGKMSLIADEKEVDNG